MQTTNVSEFKMILQELNVGGGADCPEMSLTAIKNGLEISLPNSFIFVFTDADPKDKNLLPNILQLIREKHTQVRFCNEIAKQFLFFLFSVYVFYIIKEKKILKFLYFVYYK